MVDTIIIESGETVVTTNELTTYTITVTFNSSLEVDFKEIVEISRNKKGDYWLKLQTKEIVEIPVGTYLYLTIESISKKEE